MRHLIIALAVLAAAIQANADLVTGGRLTGGTSGTPITAQDPCGGWDECDSFETDTIGTDWTAERDGWSIVTAVGLLQNVFVATEQESILRRTTPAAAANHCQVMYIASGDDINSAPGFIMRSNGATLGSATRLDVFLSEDDLPHLFRLVSYTNGTLTQFESSIAHNVTLPAWIGACVEGSGAATIVNVFDFGSTKPSPDTSGWSADYVGTLVHDGSPAVNSITGYGLRNWRNSGSGAVQIGEWLSLDATFDAEPLMSLSSSAVSAGSEEGSIPAATTITMNSVGAGTFDWDVALDTIDDCNGAAGGGTTWVTVTPAFGTGVDTENPDTIDITYSDDTCLNSESPVVAVFEFTSDEVPLANSPQTLTITRNISAVSDGSYPDYTPGVANAFTDPWGHLHPECSWVDTPCATGNVVAAGETVQNCTISSTVTIQGDGVTFSCVLWDMPGSPASPATSSPGRILQCNDPSGVDECRGLTITKSTMDGTFAANSDDPAGSGSDFFSFSTTYGNNAGVFHTALIEKSVFRGNRVSIQAGGGRMDKDSAVIEGSVGSATGYALVIRENIFRYPDYQQSGLTQVNDHMEHIAINERVDGVLIENNTFVCDEGETCNTGVFLMNGNGVTNIQVLGNRLVGDNTGPISTLAGDPAASECTTNMRWEYNDMSTLGAGGPFLFDQGSCCDSCPNMGARGPCFGNTFNGAPYTGAGCTENP